MAERNYIKGLFIKESKYDLKVSINLKTFFESIEPIQNDKGYANIVIAKRKEPGKYGDTHFAYENEWKPNKSEAAEPKPETEDDLPF